MGAGVVQRGPRQRACDRCVGWRDASTVMRAVQLNLVEAHRATFWLCSVPMVVGTAPYFALTRRVEAERADPVLDTPSSRLSPNSSRAVTRLAILFGMDSIGWRLSQLRADCVLGSAIDAARQKRNWLYCSSRLES
jgi:hypothetical protein